MWLQPTLNRVEKLGNFIQSALAAETSTPGLILVDKEDFHRNEESYGKLPKIPGWNFYITETVSMGDKVREVWPEITGNNWVGILNDDHHIVTKHWDKKLLRKLDGKNFVNANDRWMCPIKATTATAWSMPLLDAVGWPIFPPKLSHMFIDDVWEQLGRATGCWRPVMSVIVEHHHVINGRGKSDDTHEKVYSQRSWDLDKSVFDLFMKHDFEATVHKIRALQDNKPGQRYKPLDEPIHKFVPTGTITD